MKIKYALPVVATLLMLTPHFAATCCAQGFGGQHRGWDDMSSLSSNVRQPRKYNLTNRYTNEFSSSNPQPSRYAPRDKVSAGEIMNVMGDRPPGMVDIGGGMSLGEAMSRAGDPEFPFEVDTASGGPPPGPPGYAGGLPGDVGIPVVGPGPFGPDARGLGRRGRRVGRRGGIGPRGGPGFRHGPVVRSFYTPGWYSTYPAAWYPGAAAWTNSSDPWVPPEWELMRKFMGMDDSEPKRYEYGQNVTYQGDSVFVDGKNAGTTEDYYGGVREQADTGAEAEKPGDEWMALGVFLLTQEGESNDDSIVQLAVNQQGAIRGNVTSTVTSDNKTIHGLVNKDTQRVAFSIEGNTDMVAETSLDNLTRDEVTLLIHDGEERTEQRVLVRVDESDADASQGSQGDNNTSGQEQAD
ncbi:MAG: hypothetical protein ACR2NP_19970 [Pirellulaceae bacterium]